MCGTIEETHQKSTFQTTHHGVIGNGAEKPWILTTSY